MSILSFQTFFAILLVFGLIFSLYILAQRFGPRLVGGGRTRLVRIVEAIPLGDKRNLVIIEVQGRRYLLGSTNQSITLLTDVDTEETGLQQKPRLGSVHTAETASAEEVGFEPIREATRWV